MENERTPSPIVGAIIIVLVALGVGVMSFAVGTRIAPAERDRASSEMEPAAVDGGADARMVRVGDVEFPYADVWHPTPTPSATGNLVAEGGATVVAGLCGGVADVRGGDCGVDVTYVLFGKGAPFPSLVELQQTLDSGLPGSFDDMERVEVEQLTSSGAIPYLRYEFTYDRNGAREREIIAAYSMRGQGVIVVARGADGGMLEHRADIHRVMDGARLTLQDDESTAAD